MGKLYTVREIMVRRLVTLRPNQPIRDAIDILLRSRISGAPVVDADGKLIGMLSEKDCLKVFVNDAFHNTDPDHVEDYMSRTLTTIDPDADLFAAASMFLKNSFRRLPVVENGKLVGLITRRDVLDATRRLADRPAVEKPWSDSKYITDEVKAALAGRPKGPR
ncbi:MAG: CBS domain-containing protein [Kiritimatiellae bacterium]|nr:CBS domain-containing protein [Kiritimatiellia bacterium]